MTKFGQLANHVCVCVLMDADDLLFVCLSDQGPHGSLLERRMCDWARAQPDPKRFFDGDADQFKRDCLRAKVEKLELVKQLLCEDQTTRLR